MMTVILMGTPKGLSDIDSGLLFNAQTILSYMCGLVVM